MNIEELDIFIEVAQKKSFALVAHERNVAPSSISRAIAGLEDKLGLSGPSIKMQTRLDD